MKEGGGRPGEIRSADWLGLHCDDARQLAEVVPPESVDLILTSPPYADLKDYGCPGQIGFGQSLEGYLQDMRRVLQTCFQVAKPTATLWLVSDVFKKNGEMVDLPAELAKCASKAGWKLQDVVIWHKTKTLPWSHRGRLRKIFEYIHVFAKSKRYKYYPARIRETEGLQQWWVKYPERYNPFGKAPHNIWYFPIPTQGSWGNGILRHFNPFPPALVERIIELTTDPRDVVLDPFAGTGTVVAQAECMERRAVGIELNSRFVEELFPKLLAEVHRGWDSQEYSRKERQRRASQFDSLILRMRKIKIAKQIVKTLSRQHDTREVQSQLVTGLVLDKKDSRLNLPKHKLGSVNLLLIVDGGDDVDAIAEMARNLCSRPPLSKYGLEVEAHCVPVSRFTEGTFAQFLNEGCSLFVYTASTLYVRGEDLAPSDVVRFCHGPRMDEWMSHSLPPIFSDIEVKRAEIQRFLH